ncbi:OsmC family protein [Chryseobacterium sp. SSA4.19]|uniref:OsmC family protein n=1 Tax=Chryseobacterium sp. SSA4.19 TaxID=2919915 RepID=UPI001F4DCEB9|nr:OsmC family protein [Chryseobacterium sp. SSA4.19]MCJ8152788.1 OsmC family protein [Chryseobacterium sp. SSA4.19]
MTSKVTYIGGLRCSAEHLQSGTVIESDAPTDNHGKGEKFSPTDLCATSLAECALTTIAILGKDKNINIEGAYCNLQKIMAAGPRRIAEIVCNFVFSSEYSEEEKAFIEETAHNCPVAKSLHPDLVQTMVFIYQ